MKNLLSLLCLLTVGNAIFSSHASAQVNDMPNIFLSCDDNTSDGGKNFHLFEDQFGTISAYLTQNDQFSGPKVIAKFTNVTKFNCNGFSECVGYAGKSTNKKTFRFFMNLDPNSKYNDAQVTINLNGITKVINLSCMKVN